MELRSNGDILLHQTKFVSGLLEKYSLQTCKGNKAVQIDKLPVEEDVPTAPMLKQLQGHSGEFNWLATRTRPDISYYTSLLASACSRYSRWSQELAMKILRYLRDSMTQGILITAEGDLNDLVAWTDAGYAGQDTKSQSGLIVSWGGSIIVWRSSKQTVATLSTAEAEVNAATLGWQIVEGLRYLLADFGLEVPKIKVMIDNKAALTITMCGAAWRTRYFAVRGHRLHQEYEMGRAELVHCPTKEMLADALTKLATAPVIQVLHEAMNGILPHCEPSSLPDALPPGPSPGSHDDMTPVSDRGNSGECSLGMQNNMYSTVSYGSRELYGHTRNTVILLDDVNFPWEPDCLGSH